MSLSATETLYGSSPLFFIQDQVMAKVGSFDILLPLEVFSFGVKATVSNSSQLDELQDNGLIVYVLMFHVMQSFP